MQPANHTHFIVHFSFFSITSQCETPRKRIYIYIRVRRSRFRNVRVEGNDVKRKRFTLLPLRSRRRSTHFEFRRGRFPDRPGEGTWFDRSIQDGWILWSGPTATKFVSRLERFWRAAPSGVKRALFGYFQPRAESPRTPLLTRSPRSKRTVLLPTECSSFR